MKRNFQPIFFKYSKPPDRLLYSARKRRLSGCHAHGKGHAAVFNCQRPSAVSNIHILSFFERMTRDFPSGENDKSRAEHHGSGSGALRSTLTLSHINDTFFYYSWGGVMHEKDNAGEPTLPVLCMRSSGLFIYNV
jgi:hypothetical protein